MKASLWRKECPNSKRNEYKAASGSRSNGVDLWILPSICPGDKAWEQRALWATPGVLANPIPRTFLPGMSPSSCLMWLFGSVSRDRNKTKVIIWVSGQLYLLAVFCFLVLQGVILDIQSNCWFCLLSVKSILQCIPAACHVPMSGLRLVLDLGL